ncbi:MAG: NACHT domain-containing protein [Isosphaeraceae bacterium]
MIKKVRAMWISGFLDDSMSGSCRIDPVLREMPAAVDRPLDRLVQPSERCDRGCPSSISINELTGELEYAPLILGVPGSGKTTLLLELARHLLDCAERNHACPVPVIFPLAGWTSAGKVLADWLVDELMRLYFVPRAIAREWVAREQVLPLLDGLDDVKEEHRAACVNAINAFRRGHGLIPLVVASRLADYERLSVKLQLDRAIVVSTMRRAQVDEYLRRSGPAGERVGEAIGKDPTLLELLNTPLMLRIFTSAYEEQSKSPPPANAIASERREHIFESYVRQMLKRGPEARITSEQTYHWLSWLAWQMTQRGQSVFSVEGLQLDWLPNRKRLAARAIPALFHALVYGLIGGLLCSFVGISLWGSGAASNALGWVGVLVGVLVGVWVGASTNSIAPAEAIQWSWTKARYGLQLTLLVVGLVVVFGQFLAPPDDPDVLLVRDLTRGLEIGLLCTVSIGIVFRLAGALVGRWVDAALFLVVYSLLTGLLYVLGFGPVTKLFDRPIVWTEPAPVAQPGMAVVPGPIRAPDATAGTPIYRPFGNGGNIAPGQVSDIPPPPPTRLVSPERAPGVQPWPVGVPSPVIVPAAPTGNVQAPPPAIVPDARVGRFEGPPPAIALDARTRMPIGGPIVNADTVRPVPMPEALFVGALAGLAKIGSAIGVGAAEGTVVGIAKGLGDVITLVIRRIFLEMVALLVPMGIALGAGMVAGEVPIKTSPNQGITLAKYNSMLFGFAAILMVSLVFALDVYLVPNFGGVFSRVDFSPKTLLLGLVLGLPVGTVVALNCGGSSAIRHYSLRYRLIRSGLTPWRFVRFLDDCAGRILLTKVGGGYTFYHPLLLDHFASRYVQRWVGDKKGSVAADSSHHK